MTYTRTKKGWQGELDRTQIQLDRYVEKCRMSNIGPDRYQIAEYKDYIQLCADQVKACTKV